MNRIQSIVAAAAIALASVGAAHANERAWDGKAQEWTHPSTSLCKLVLENVYQPNQGQPIHLVVRNASEVRLQYTLNVRVVRDKKEEFRGSVMVDNANPGERSDRHTAAYPSTIKGTTVLVTLASCALRN